MDDIAERLRRWASIDDFAALQDPENEDMYMARSAVVSLLVRKMEETGLSWRGAVEALRASRTPTLPPVPKATWELLPTVTPPKRARPIPFAGQAKPGSKREPTLVGITPPPIKK